VSKKSISILTFPLSHMLSTAIIPVLPASGQPVQPVEKETGNSIQYHGYEVVVGVTSRAQALLDVFTEEPLPEQHLFWFHEKIIVTPHIASVTNPGSASAKIVENYRRALGNEPLLNLVDMDSGY